MEEKTFTLKIEPEDSLEYNLNQEVNLEIKTKLDTPIKSEVILKEEIHDFEQLEYEPDFISLPPIIEDLDALQGNSECSNFTEQFRLSQVKFKSEIISSLKPKRKRATCKEEGCSTYYALKGVKCGEHGGTWYKCKEEGCCKYAKRGGRCIKHGGIQNKYTCKAESCFKSALKGGKCGEHGGTRYKCKEEGCCKYAKRGGKCIKHGGIQNKYTCKEEGCFKKPLKGSKCFKHGGTYIRYICKEESCFKYAFKGGKCLNHGIIPSKNTSKDEGFLNMLSKEVNVSNTEESRVPIDVKKKTELDTPIKSEVILKEEIHDFKQLEYEPDFISLPPIIEELDALQGNSECSNFTEQFRFSEVKFKSEIISSFKPKRKRATCKEEGCSIYALKGGKCGEHGGTRNKCKEEGCCKYAKRGGMCIKHGGIQNKYTCKEEGCFKYALKGGKCIKHGGVQTKYSCIEEGCLKKALKGYKCYKHGGIEIKYTCKEEVCYKKSFERR